MRYPYSTCGDISNNLQMHPVGSKFVIFGLRINRANMTILYKIFILYSVLYVVLHTEGTVQCTVCSTPYRRYCTVYCM